MKRKTKLKPTAVSGRRKKKCDRLTDYPDLYGMPDDNRPKRKRVGVPRFSKSPVTLSPFSTDAETRYFERLRSLKAHPARHLLRSLYEDIKNWSSAKPLSERGFLLTTAGEPAGSQYLGEQLGVAIEDIDKALPVLRQLGFIERISMNGQTESKKPKRKQTRKKSKTSRSKTTKKSSKKSKQKNSQKTQNVAKHAEEHHTKGLPDSAGLKMPDPARSRKSLKKAKANTKAKSNVGIDNNKKEKKKNGSGNRKRKGEANELNSPEAPTTALPTLPRKSDLGGSVRFHTPPGSVRNRSEPQAIGDVIRSIEHRFDFDSKKFAEEVYRALALRWDFSTPQAHRELGSFGSLWTKAKASSLPPSVMNGLWDRAINEARKIGKRKTKRGKPAAIWCSVFNKILAARCSENQCVIRKISR